MQKKIAALYVRRTGEESDEADRQVAVLRGIAEQEGYAVGATWIDTAPIDARRRPALDALRRTVAAGEIDLVLIPSLVTLGMPVERMVTFVWQLDRARVRLLVADDGIDTATTDGAAWMAAILRLHDAQAGLHRERVRLGQQRAKQAGVHCGRPATSEAKQNRVKAALAAGGGIRATARACGVSPATVWRQRNLIRMIQTIGAPSSR